MDVLLSDKVVVVKLSRRNLETLLAKLNGNPPGSHVTIERLCENDLFLHVKGEENEDHYGEREPGWVHPMTEAKLTKATHSERVPCVHPRDFGGMAHEYDVRTVPIVDGPDCD